MAGALPDHDRVHRLNPMYHTAQVHIEDVVPVVERVRVDLAGDPDAGVVEQVIDAPGFLHRLGHGALERRVVAHVEFDRMHLRRDR